MNGNECIWFRFEQDGPLEQSVLEGSSEAPGEAVLFLSEQFPEQSVISYNC